MIVRYGPYETGHVEPLGDGTFRLLNLPVTVDYLNYGDVVNVVGGTVTDVVQSGGYSRWIVCGPFPMFQEVFDMLEEMGLDFRIAHMGKQDWFRIAVKLEKDNLKELLPPFFDVVDFAGLEFECV